MVASSVRLSPLLSVHVTTTLSPGLPPAKRNDRNGFFATAGPHSAASTVLPLCVAVTFWMNHAGMSAPFASLRWPVSISWLISTFTSTLSPTMLARIFIGSAISASAPAQGDLDFLGRVIELAVARLHQRDDVGRLPHLHARVDPRLRALRDLEVRREDVGILLDQDRHRFRVGDLARDGERNDRAILGDVRRGDRDVLALGRTRASEGFHGVVQRFRVERRLVPLRPRGPGPEQARRHGEAEDRRPARALQDFPATAIHAVSPRENRNDNVEL